MYFFTQSNSGLKGVFSKGAVSVSGEPTITELARNHHQHPKTLSLVFLPSYFSIRTPQS